MLDAGIGPWEEEGLVAAVTPSHDIRRLSVWTTDLEDLAITFGLANAVCMDDDPVSDTRLHGGLLSLFSNSSSIVMRSLPMG
jgi:hypothetical protein